MIAFRQALKLACTNIVKRPALLSRKPLPHLDYTKTFISTNPPSLLNNVQFAGISSIFNSRPGLLNSICVDQINQQRNVTQYSLTKGKRRTVHAVLKRFYRLDWGIWIRTKCGRHKKLYKKSSARKRRLKHHVFCNAQQSNLLDKMVSRYWRRPKYFVDDPYEPYNKREEFFWTRKKPIVRDY